MDEAGDFRILLSTYQTTQNVEVFICKFNPPPQKKTILYLVFSLMVMTDRPLELSMWDFEFGDNISIPANLT
jgi:hypothetical protein